MKTIAKKMGIMGMAFMLLSGAFADEVTGREFNDLVKDLNKELDNARTKVEKLETAQSNVPDVDMKKIIPARAKSLRELRSLTESFDDTKSTSEKKVLSKKIESKVLEVAGHSADFLEGMKNKMLNQDKQLEVIEDSLSSVVFKMDKLQKLAARKMASGDPGEAEKLKEEAKNSLKRTAKMVEMLAAKTGKQQQWKSVRQTIALQYQLLNKNSVANNKILELLDGQKQVYEMVLAQISIARQSIAGEREVLAQIALGEVAKSLLRKAAGLLLGNYRIENIGVAAVEQSTTRQKDILAFLQQEEYEGEEYGSVSGSDSSDDYPSGYEALLNQ